jgi:hypothetical protein
MLQGLIRHYLIARVACTDHIVIRLGYHLVTNKWLRYLGNVTRLQVELLPEF